MQPRYFSIQDAKFLRPFTIREQLGTLVSWVFALFCLVVLGLYIELPLVERYAAHISLQNEEAPHLSPAAGVVEQVSVVAGQHVVKDQILASFRSMTSPSLEHYNLKNQSLMNAGNVLEVKISRFRQQLVQLELEYELSVSKSTSNRRKAVSSDQHLNTILAVKTDELEKQEQLFKRERISQLTLNLKALEVSDLKQNVAQHLLEIAEIDTELRIAKQTFAANQDLLELRISETELRLVENKNDQKVFGKDHFWRMRAYQNGIVGSINVRRGELVEAGFESFSLIPEFQSPIIEIFQPANKRLTSLEGDEVRVALDAYKPELHGLFTAQITRIGRTPSFEIPSYASAASNIQHKAYKHIATFTSEQSLPVLEDGYTASVSVLVDNYNILEWLLAPLILREY
jgi:multidrug resistance efflux pump